MAKKVKHTTVILYPKAGAIKEELIREWTLKKVLSAAIEVFNELDGLAQKRAIIKAGEDSNA